MNGQRELKRSRELKKTKRDNETKKREREREGEAEGVERRGGENNESTYFEAEKYCISREEGKR